MVRLILFFCLFTFPALAADMAYKAPLPSPAPFSWAGLYLEGYGLYGANITNTTVTLGPATADIASAPHGPGLGGAFGYNWQNGQFVFGLRGDLAYANLQGGGQASVAGLGGLSVGSATNYLGDLDASLGLCLSSDCHLLGYTGGGFAFGGAKPNLQVANLAAAASNTSTGWNALLGLKYTFTTNWTIGIEGDYFQLGDRVLSAGNLATSSTKFHIVEQKLTLGYRF